MNSTSPCWENITEKEFKHWLVEVSKTHHIFSDYDELTKETTYFIEDEGLNKIRILTKTNNYSKVYYYKNSNVIGS